MQRAVQHASSGLYLLATSPSCGMHVRAFSRGCACFKLSDKWKQLNFAIPDPVEFPRLTPQQVSSLIRVNETYHEPSVPHGEENVGAVKWFECNQLPANNPIEDRRAEARLKTTGKNQHLFGVFDGHAGCACAQAVSERLFTYIAVTMASPDMLEKVRHLQFDPHEDLLHHYPQVYGYFNTELEDMYKRSLAKLGVEVLSLYDPLEDSNTEEYLTSAFTRLDQDIVVEALPSTNNAAVNSETLQIAFSGACACVAYVNETDLYICNVGDCRAVLGVHAGEDNWDAIELSKDHNADNANEVARLQRSHPNEQSNLIKGGRLFGDLQPLRAFGDVRYKWPTRDLKHILRTKWRAEVIGLYGNRLVPSNYQTPPYLTAEPELTHHRLTPKDKFLVIASDGLWEHLTPEKVVNLVAGYMDGRQVLGNFQITDKNVTLKEINQLLIRRKSSLANRPVDSNVATHLIRNALGPDHARLSALLAEPVARDCRDDITVTVIFFDTDYIMNAQHN